MASRFKTGLLPSAVAKLPSLICACFNSWVATCFLMGYATGSLMNLLVIPICLLGFIIQFFIEEAFPPRHDDKINWNRTFFANLIVIVLSLGISNLAYKWVCAGNVATLRYDNEFQFFAIASMIVLVISGVFGAIVGLVPAKRYFSYTSATVHLIMYFALYVFAIFLGNSLNSVIMIGGCVNVIMFFIMMNQQSINDAVGHKRVLGVNTALRVYNFRLTVKLCGVLVLFIGAATLVLTGIYFLLKCLLLLFLRSVISEESTASNDIEEAISDMFNEGLITNSTVNKVLFGIFLVLLIVLVIALIVRMFVGHLIDFKEIVRFFKNLFANILAWIKDLRLRTSVKHVKSVPRYEPDRKQPYRDEVIRNRSGENLSNVKNYSQFARAINAIDNVEEQFCFAYAVFIRQVRKIKVNGKRLVTDGATPREICEILADYGKYSISDISDLYELVRYAEYHSSNENCAQMVNRLIMYVEQNYNIIDSTY